MRFFNPDEIQIAPRPLLIGCSGGGGHNSAILAITQSLKKKPNYNLDLYQPQEHSFYRVKNHRLYKKMMTGIRLTYDIWLSRFIRWVLQFTPFPLIPTIKEIKDEILNLQKSNTAMRPYIDMLLDVHCAGYESAAIWNVLQKQDRIEDLKKLIAFQGEIDKANYKEVKQYFLSMLINANNSGSPYSEVVSTQAVGLPALCDAVSEYNKFNIRNNQNFIPIEIQQYLTDLPTMGCVHFLSTLASLSDNQRQQMNIHAVGGLNQAIARKFNLENPPFNNVVTVSPTDNPMVRHGFLQSGLKEITFEEDIDILAQKINADDQEYAIKSGEKIASIMLGSQAGLDTAKYVAKLMGTYDKIFVFGGNTAALSLLLDEEELKLPENKHGRTIIRLDNQDDEHMAPILTRSNLMIIRGGGLSVMEQMAMHHPCGQSIMIHHKDSEKSELTSGIPWEDCNTNALIQTLSSETFGVKKTSPNRFEGDLQGLPSSPPAFVMGH